MTEHVNSRMDTFLDGFFKSHFKDEKAFRNLIRGYTSKKISYQLAKSMYQRFLLSGGKDQRKLSIQAVGYKTSAKKSKNFDNEEVDKPWLEYEIPSHLKQFKDQYISDILEFKNSLELQPNLSTVTD